MFKKIFSVALTALVLSAPYAVQACPGCASALNQSLGSAFNASVLFMMAMPFTLFGAFVAGFIMLNRHAQKNSAGTRSARGSTSQAKTAAISA